jgi:hypothetical protein
MNEKPNTDQLADELAALFWEQTDLSAIADRHEAETIAEKSAADFLIQNPELWRHAGLDPERVAE